MSIPIRGAAALLCGLALGVSSCGRGDQSRGRRGGDAPAQDFGPPVSGGTAVIAEMTDMEKPMPLVWQTNLDSDLVDILYMGLTRMAWQDGRPIYMLSDESPMAIAYRWQYANPDSSAMRFFMRSNLKWSDGHPITAEDVVWTYRSIKDPRVASPRQEDIALVDSVRAESDSVVVFYFKRRSPSMLFQAGMPIAPRHAYDDVPPAGIRTHRSFSNPERLVVSGPFRISNWRPNERITFQRNPSFKPQARLNGIVIRVIPDPTTRVTELETGGVDMARPITLDHVRGLRERMPEARIMREERRFWEFVSYNPRRFEAFADPQIRRALTQALNIPDILQRLGMGEFVEAAYGPYPPIFRDLYDPQRDRPVAHDAAAARRVLESKGWRDSDGDGVLDKDGKPFRFTLLTNSGNQRRGDVAQLVQAQWRAIGVDARIQQQDHATVVSRETEGQDYEASLSGWGVALDPDVGNFFLPGGPFNINHYDNPQVTALINQARLEPDYERAAQLWRTVADRVVQDQPYTWILYYDVVSGVSDRLQGMRVDSYGAYQNVWEWWIPADRQRRGGRAAPPAEEQK